MERWITALLVVAAWVSIPVALQAPPQGYEVQVHLADRQGAPVPGITVMLRDESGQNTIAKDVTDAQGEANFPDLSQTSVRLSVSGAAPSGVSVTLGQVSFIDDDAILVRTDIGGPLVALVMDTDGSIYIDPSTLEPEDASGGPEHSPELLEPTATLAGTTPALTPVETPPAARAEDKTGGVPWLLIIGGLAVSGLVLWVGSERRVS